jgi:hypothetical protein
MPYPELLVLLAAPEGAAWRDQAEALRRAGHFALDATTVEAALAAGGAAAARLLRACDAAVLPRPAPALEAAFRARRRPVYAEPEQLRLAGRSGGLLAPPWYALRGLDR